MSAAPPRARSHSYSRAPSSFHPASQLSQPKRSLDIGCTGWASAPSSRAGTHSRAHSFSRSSHSTAASTWSGSTSTTSTSISTAASGSAPASSSSATGSSGSTSATSATSTTNSTASGSGSGYATASASGPSSAASPSLRASPQTSHTQPPPSSMPPIAYVRHPTHSRRFRRPLPMPTTTAPLPPQTLPADERERRDRERRRARKLARAALAQAQAERKAEAEALAQDEERAADREEARMVLEAREREREARDEAQTNGHASRPKPLPPRRDSRAFETPATSSPPANAWLPPLPSGYPDWAAVFAATTGDTFDTESDPVEAPSAPSGITRRSISADPRDARDARRSQRASVLAGRKSMSDARRPDLEGVSMRRTRTSAGTRPPSTPTSPSFPTWHDISTAGALGGGAFPPPGGNSGALPPVPRIDPNRALPRGQDYLISPPCAPEFAGLERSLTAGTSGTSATARTDQTVRTVRSNLDGGRRQHIKHASSASLPSLPCLPQPIPVPAAPPLEDHIFMFANIAQLQALIAADDELVEDYPNWRVYRHEMLYAEATPEFAGLLNKHVLQRGVSLAELDDIMGRPGVDGTPGGHERVRRKREHKREKKNAGCIVM